MRTKRMSREHGSMFCVLAHRGVHGRAFCFEIFKQIFPLFLPSFQSSVDLSCLPCCMAPLLSPPFFTAFF